MLFRKIKTYININQNQPKYSWIYLPNNIYIIEDNIKNCNILIILTVYSTRGSFFFKVLGILWWLI
jgi:hypothetical protein